MNNIKSIVAKNIAELRQSKGMTQLELAEKLNYSDKAVSKWERAESMPDISVLVEIADMFGVPLDYLVREEHERPKPKKEKPVRNYNKKFITALSVLLVWLVAFIAFVVLSIATDGSPVQWLMLVYAIPLSMIVWLVLNSVWFDVRRNYLIISLLMWSLLLAVHLSFLLPAGINIWQMYLLGIPGQIIILIWSKIRDSSSE